MRLACGVLYMPDKILEEILLILKLLFPAYLSVPLQIRAEASRVEMNSSKEFFNSEPDLLGIGEINESSL